MRTVIVWVVLLGGVVLLVWFSRGRGVLPKLDLTPPSGEPAQPSIYSAIEEQVRAAPDEPLDYERLPPIPPTSEHGLKFAPGAMDALLGSGQATSDEWKTVREVARAVNAGRISDWRVVEKNVSKIPTASCVDTVLGDLSAAEFTPALKRTFWELARRSRDYEAVKWGIAIGSVQLREDEVPELLTLARHAEFALYTSHALLRESGSHPELKRHLVSLLPTSREWGVIKLIEYIVRDDSLIHQKPVQRDVLVYGMENCQVISMEVGFTIAKAIDLPFFCQAAAGDERVYRAMLSLGDTLINEPQPLGGLAQLNEWPAFYDAYLAMIRRHPADARQLVALTSLEHFLADGKLDWQRRSSELEKVRHVLEERLAPAVIRRSLGDERDTWAALQLIREKKLAELVPDVEAQFTKKPEPLAIQILGELGGKKQLETMLARIPSLVDLEARKTVPLSRTNVIGPQYRHDFTYALIVEAMGKLATPAAVDAIKTAAVDFNPQVRFGACKAVAQLPAAAVDADLRRLVTERLSDSPEYLAKAARLAAEHIGVPLPAVPAKP